MANRHGDFLWYELITSDLDKAEAFYAPLLNWRFRPSGQENMDYRLFAASEGDVGGIMPTPPGAGSGGWFGYVAVDDIDVMAASITDSGGKIHVGPEDIPGVGRFAFYADPTGAMGYVMTPAPQDGESIAFSYDRPRLGHCAWKELSTSDPEAAKRFYGKHFGWVQDGEMDMGPLGKYEFLRHAGRAPDGSPMGAGMLGAVMPMVPGGAPVPVWTFYFRVADIDAAAASVKELGGTLIQEPIEIPGGDYSLVAADNQGAHFGLVGARAS